MVWNVRGVFQFSDEDEHDVEDVDWGGDGYGDWSKEGKQEEEEFKLTTTISLFQKPEKSSQGKEKGSWRKCGCNNDASPNGVAVIDKVDPVNQIGDDVKDK